LQALLRAGGDANECGEDGRSLLCRGVSAGQHTSVETLLEHGADPFAKDGRNELSSALSHQLRAAPYVGKELAATLQRYERRARLCTVTAGTEPTQRASLLHTALGASPFYDRRALRVVERFV
jgi:hypothetical protein